MVVRRGVEAAMELRQWVRSVLGGARDQRGAWDAVWAAVLDAVLRDAPLPEATPRDIEEELRQFFSDHGIEEGHQAAVGEAWSTNRGGPAEAWSELWARLAATDGSCEWLHLSSRGRDRHAELQLVDAVNDRPQLRSVTVLANVSPCSECACALRQVAGRARLSLRFAALFAPHGDNHRAGLRQLAAAGAQLAVFGPRDWALLLHRQAAERRHADGEARESPAEATAAAAAAAAAPVKRPASEDGEDEGEGEGEGQDGEQPAEPSAKRPRL